MNKVKCRHLISCKNKPIDKNKLDSKINGIRLALESIDDCVQEFDNIVRSKKCDKVATLKKSLRSMNRFSHRIIFFVDRLEGDLE